MGWVVRVVWVTPVVDTYECVFIKIKITRPHQVAAVKALYKEMGLEGVFKQYEVRACVCFFLGLCLCFCWMYVCV